MGAGGVAEASNVLNLFVISLKSHDEASLLGPKPLDCKVLAPTLCPRLRTPSDRPDQFMTIIIFMVRDY
jgi:hypothetical protein